MIVESEFIVSSYDPKLGETAHTLEDRIRIQNDNDKVAKHMKI